MAIVNRFSTIDKAILTSTGNSLVLCGSTSITGSNTSDMITPAGGTTRDWTLAGSSATINILSNSTVLYAELIWYSTVKNSDSSAVDLRSVQDDPIDFITPTGTIPVTPENQMTFTAQSGNIDRFRSANVTNIIKNSLGGTYTVSKVPTSIPSTGLSNTRAGWTLAVVYRNSTFSPQRILFSSGITNAIENTTVQEAVIGFSTPLQQANLKGNLFFACVNGEPLIGTKTVEVGPSFANLSLVGNAINSPHSNPGTAPNNPNNSFFSGIINKCDPLNINVGLLDITGTKGTLNHDAFVPTQTLGGRNKWDLTNIDITNTLLTNQNQTTIQINESGIQDGIQILAIGAQVTAQAPNLSATLSTYDSDGSGAYNVEQGEVVTYSVQINNSGDVDATNIIVSTTLDSGCEFILDSAKLNGVSLTGVNITTGINIGSVSSYGTTNLTFDILVKSIPSNGIINAFANYSYQFMSGSGSPTYTNYVTTNVISVTAQAARLNVASTVSKAIASVGETLQYTINITNNGNALAKGLTFQNVVSPYCSFNAGSVTVNGIANGSLNPNTGFTLPDISANGNSQITFSTTINSLPPSTVVDNTSLVKFQYNVNAYTIPTIQTVSSNNSVTQIQYYEIVGFRSNNNNYPNINDVVTYTLTLTNVGNIAATNVQVQEPTIIGASFVSGSVKVDGVINNSLNPFTGFSIGTIPSNGTATIAYSVTINQIQSSGIITNIAEIPFKYQISQSNPVVSSQKDSNLVTTRANFVNIAIVETVNKGYAIVNDTLYYSINVSNTGNIDATSTIFSSNIQSGSTFIAGSVAINGMPKVQYDVTSGFSIGTLSPGNTVNITFRALVTTIPSPNSISNNVQLIYSYLPDPSGSPITNTINGNAVQTTINKAEISIVKSVNKAYAQVGESLIYTVNITNIGTVSLKNINFGDNITSYLQFVNGSVYVDGSNHSNYNPNNGFLLGDLNANETFTVTFTANVTSVPPIGVIVNVSDISYQYQMSPTSALITQTSYSNSVETQVLVGNLSIVKSANKAYATIGDTIAYSFNIVNTGNTTVKEVNFLDSIPIQTSFVNGSVNINGIAQPTLNPTVGISLGTLVVGQVIGLNFNATVTSLPNPNIITNNASALFKYSIDPSKPLVTNTATSNNVSTTINVASAKLTLKVNKLYARISDVLSYSFEAENTGTVQLSNLVVSSTLPSGVDFTPGSVKVDGVTVPSAGSSGFALGNITPGGKSKADLGVGVNNAAIPALTAVLTALKGNSGNNSNNGNAYGQGSGGGNQFHGDSIDVSSLFFPMNSSTTPSNVVTAQSSVAYNYNIDPNGSTLSSSTESNQVSTTINESIVTHVLTVDKAYATVGDTLTYTCVVSNLGNIDISNVNFQDVISSYTTFIPGSVQVNSIVQSSYNPNTGFPLGTILFNNSTTIAFQVTVNTLPASGAITNSANASYDYYIDPAGPATSANTSSNTVTSYIKVGNLAITKSANRSYVKLNDVISYNFVISNIGNVDLGNLTFQDTMQIGSIFNSNSVTINGVVQASFNPNTGFNLGTLPIGASTTIAFNATANTIPALGKLYNTGTVAYSYYIDPNTLPIITNKPSNQTMIDVRQAIIATTKTVDKAIAYAGETLRFTISYRNDGNVPAENIFFSDTIVNPLSFIPNSIMVNNTTIANADPNVGFNIANIPANGGTATITFLATVNSRPSDGAVIIPYNASEFGQYTVGVKYVAGDNYTTRPMKMDINSVNTGTIYNLPATNTNSSVVTIPVNLNTGSNTFTFKGDGVNYSADLGRCYLLLRTPSVLGQLSGNTFRFLGLGSNLIATIGFNTTTNKLVVTSTGTTSHVYFGANVYFSASVYNYKGVLKATASVIGNANANAFATTLNGIDFMYGDYITITHAESSARASLQGTVINAPFSFTSNFGTVNLANAYFYLTNGGVQYSTTTLAALNANIATGTFEGSSQVDTSTGFVTLIGGTTHGTSAVIANITVAGLYYLVVQYISLNSSRNLMLDINDVSTGTLYSLPQTTSWVTTDIKNYTIPVNLTLGNNNIVFKGNGINYAPDLGTCYFILNTPNTLGQLSNNLFTFLGYNDLLIATIGFDTTVSTTTIADVTVNAINGTISSSATTVLSGAYVGAIGDTDGYVIVPMTVPVSGIYNLAIKYISGDTNRPLKVDVNGVNTGTTYAVLKTSGWTVADAQLLNITVNLNSGGNNIKLYNSPNTPGPWIGSLTTRLLTTGSVATSTKKLVVTSSGNQANIYYPGSVYFTVSLYDYKNNLKATSTVAPSSTASDFVTALNGLSFDYGDYLKIVHMESSNRAKLKGTVINAPFSLSTNFSTLNLATSYFYLTNAGIQYSTNSIAPLNMNVANGTLSGGAKIDKITNFATLMGGTNNGSSAVNINIVDVGSYDLRFQYISLDSNRNLNIDVNSINTGTVYSLPQTNDWNVTSANVFTLPGTFSFNKGNNTIMFHGDGTNYATDLSLAYITKNPFNATVNVTLGTYANGAVTNSGYAAYIGGPSDGSVTITVSVPKTSVYNMTINYRNGSRGFKLDVNGVNTGRVYTVPATSISTFNVTLPLNEGNNTIKFYGNGTSAYGPDVSAAVFTSAVNPFYLGTATLANGAYIDSVTNYVVHIGGTANGSVTMTTNVEQTGSYYAEIKYLAGTINMPFKMNINGSYTGTVYNALKTASWNVSDAKIVTVPVNLTAGSNTVEFYGDGTANYAPAMYTVYFTKTNIVNLTVSALEGMAVVNNNTKFINYLGGATNNTISNLADIDYNFLVGTQTISIINFPTNTAQTIIQTAELTILKVVDKAFAQVGDTITYTVYVTNSGSVNNTNQIFTDVIPIGGTFVSGSVVLNGTSNISLNPNIGFSIPDLIPNQTNLIIFSVLVNSLPPTGTINNIANVNFSYQLSAGESVQNKTVYSNSTMTYIKNPILNITKEVNKAYATIGDVISYSFTIDNPGNTNCDNVFFQDIIQSDATFNTGSVLINSSTQPSFDVNTGFDLGTIIPDVTSNSITTIDFSVTVNTLPTNSILNNKGNINFKYHVDPTAQYLTTQIQSNTVSTQINIGRLTATKAVSKSVINIGGTLLYTVNIVNTGNVTATNINFRDVIPTGANFIAGSVTIDGVTQASYDPYQSFSLSSLAAGASVQVAFSATVSTIPAPYLINNAANITYSYKIDPAASNIVTQVNTNTVTTTVNTPELNVLKLLDKTVALPGEIITYTVILSNTGNINLDNILYVENLNGSVTFQAGSVTVDNVSHPSYDPTVGFNLGTIVPSSSITVIFTVKVNDTPVNNTVSNYANGTYTYQVGDTTATVTETKASNTVTTVLVTGAMTSNKTVDLAYATLTNELNYSIAVNNTGQATNSSLYFMDYLSSGASFVAGSVIIDGVSKPSFNPINGFSLNNLLAGATTNISFKVSVVSIPSTSQVKNYATITGVYSETLGSYTLPLVTNTNTVTTQINVGTVSNIKSVSKNYIKVGDTMTYTSIVTNIGNTNAINVKLFDSLQSELLYLPGTVRINGVVVPTANPSSILLGNLLPNETSTIAFDVQVTTLPSPPQVNNISQIQFNYNVDPNALNITSTIQSNMVTTNVVLGQVSITNSVDKTIATMGDTVTFTVILINTGNVIAKNVFLQDAPTTGVTFNASSVYVNGVNQGSYNPATGFSLGNIGIGNSVTVNFSTTVTTVPVTNVVTSQAFANFTYVLDPAQPEVAETISSSTTTTNIAIGSLSVTKAVDKQFATIGQELTYTVTITNTGNINATNVVFLDPAPQNTTYVLGSVIVNGTSQPNYNPTAGFALNTMLPGEIVTVVYKVQVIS